MESLQDFSGDWSVGIATDCPILWLPPIISGTGKATYLKFCVHTHRLDRIKTQKPMKKIGKSSRGRRQRVPKIFTAPMHVYGVSRGRLCDSTFFLFVIG